ncbi:MAG TPA: class I SAM-dependent methyltransferase [Candidatus Saccharimonadales bacterium]|nr:class I SAM-dependent methyltransferase [Candidatus Saccharimonadales bacterium]
MTRDISTKKEKTPTATCAFCGSAKLTEVINFGDVALAGGFLKKEAFATEKKYPLVIVFCDDCYAVQVRDHIDPKVLFATDFYFSSAIKTLRDHFADYASEVTGRFLPNPQDATVIEFGSNDGVLLEPLAAQGIGRVIGVDPAKNIIETIKDPKLTLINDFFNVPTANAIVEKYGKADLVMANNVFAHITDINGTTEGVREALKDDGVFIFEVHYLGKIIEGLQYDFIYHEHTYYYSLLALENHLSRHGMVIFDIKPISIHGGSIRFYAAKKGSRYAKNISPSVEALRQQEKDLGYDKPETYKEFASRVAAKKQKLMTLLESLRKKGRTVAGYGASGRANTIIQYCGITDKHLDFMIDDAPAKLGMYTPGSHLEIRNNQALKADKPDYIVLFAWAFYEEIAAKCEDYLESGGRIIVPLPDVRITMYPTDDKDL